MKYQSKTDIFCKESFEHQYASALKMVMEDGTETSDRTGVGRKRIPNANFSIPCMNFALPVLKGKAVFPKMGIKEITWMMMGLTNISFLEVHGVTYWREWANINGDLGPVYGKQFRDFGGVDQLRNAIVKLINDPYSSQNIINLWNPVDLPQMALPPCHFSYTLQVLPDIAGENRLNIHLVQRSADAFLGVPYNAIMASYMLCLFANITGLKPGWVFWTLQDFHIYTNHFKQVDQYLNNVEENRYGSIGNPTYIDSSCLPFYNSADVSISNFERLTKFFDYCHKKDFKNIILYKNETQGYGKIEAEIAI